MQERPLVGESKKVSRRTVLESIAGIAAVSALHPSLESLAKPVNGTVTGLTHSIDPISRAPSGLATYELCEFKVAVHAGDHENLNPYRASELALDVEFTLPAGKTMRVPGFYAQDYTPMGSAGTPVEGSKGWRVRFSGPEAGAYKGNVELRVRGKLVASRELPPFVLTKSNNHGMIHVSRSAPRYLEFDDGVGYFPVGQNVCWTTDVSSIPSAKLAVPTLPWNEAFARWFNRMGQSGANWARLFIKPNFYMETGEPWAWELESAWRLDQVLEQARKNGINVCLCFNAERSDEGGAYHGSMDLFRASNTAWGQLLKSQGLSFDKFFLNPLCREMYRDKIRYFVARWGYSPNIFSWEFWNEIGTVEHRERMGPWLREMTAYTRSIDAWGHLIKSSTSDAWEPERWGAEVGDLNDVHPYFGWSGEEEPKNFGEFIPRHSSALYAAGRPFIVGETGIAREFSTTFGLAGDMADKDVTCFHLHGFVGRTLRGGGGHGNGLVVGRARGPARRLFPFPRNFQFHCGHQVQP